MTDKLPNLYSLPSMPGTDPLMLRFFQDLVDRTNYLTTELDRVRGNIPSQLDVRAHKESPPQGIIKIPSPQGDGFIRVSKDGVIVSYANPIPAINYPRLIFTDTVDRANSGAAVTTIITIMIPPGTLKATGDFLEFVGEYVLVSAGITKIITYIFGGVNLNANPWQNTLASTQITLIGRVYRTSPTTTRNYIAASLPFTGQTTSFTQFGDITVASMDTETLTFVVTLQGGASNDVTHKVSHMFAVRQS